MLFVLSQAAQTTMDWAQLGADVITALTAPLTVVVVWAVRKAVPKIPRTLLPFIALGGGPAVHALLSTIAGVESQSAVVMALLGMAAVWLRESWSTYKEHGLKA
jgi:hypothetical protein